MSEIRSMLNKLHHPFCSAIVPAAGSSRRMGGENKLFMELNGIPVLIRTLQAIDQTQLVDEIIVAAQREMLEQVAELCHRAALHKPVRVVTGGASRAESVLAAALEANQKARLLAVHDGARPLIRPEEFDAVVRFAARTNAAAPAIPVTDTVKIADSSGLVSSTPDRNTLFAVQTPQVFDSSLLKAALQSAINDRADITDDCSAAERIGKQIYLTAGSRENLKITTPLDIVLATAILNMREKQE